MFSWMVATRYEFTLSYIGETSDITHRLGAMTFTPCFPLQRQKIGDVTVYLWFVAP